MRDQANDPFVFEVIHGQPVPSVPTSHGHLYTARDIARLFGDDENHWMIRWEKHFDPEGRSPLFVVEGRKPVPLHGGKLPIGGQPCYTADELTGGDDCRPELGRLLKPEWSYAELLALHASSNAPVVGEVATEAGPDLANDRQWIASRRPTMTHDREPLPDHPSLKASELFGMPCRREIAALRRSGLDRYTARYTMAAVLLERAGRLIQDAKCRGEEHRHDGVLENNALQATEAARDSLDTLITYHLIPAAARLADRAVG